MPDKPDKMFDLPTQEDFVMRFDVDWSASLRERISQALADEFNDEKARSAVDSVLYVIDPQGKS